MNFLLFQTENYSEIYKSGCEIWNDMRGNHMINI